MYMRQNYPPGHVRRNLGFGTPQIAGLKLWSVCQATPKEEAFDWLPRLRRHTACQSSQQAP